MERGYGNNYSLEDGNMLSMLVNDPTDDISACPTLLLITRLLIFLFSHSEENETPTQILEHCLSQFVLDRERLCSFAEGPSAPKLLFLL